MEHQRRNPESKELQQAHNGSAHSRLSGSDIGLAGTESPGVQLPPSSFSSSYEQWLSSLSKQHRELLESRSGCITDSIPSIVSNGVGGSASSLVDGRTTSPAFHSLEISEISANLSDDMKEMTNCVRQAIRSSSLERKSTKEAGNQVVQLFLQGFKNCLGVWCSETFSKQAGSLSIAFPPLINILNICRHSCFSLQVVGMSTRSTQTASQYVSIGLQTDILPSSRGTGLHSKAWSPRPSSATTSSLASARTRQISTSLDKVHSRIERPCCSPKYGSPKLQRRVSSGNYILFERLVLHFEAFLSRFVKVFSES